MCGGRSTRARYRRRHLQLERLWRRQAGEARVDRRHECHGLPREAQHDARRALHTRGQSDVRTLQYVDTGLINGTTYYYVVSAANVLGESGNSPEASATPALPPDLVISSFSAPTSAAAGSLVAVSVTAKNQGTGTANDVDDTVLRLREQRVGFGRHAAHRNTRRSVARAWNCRNRRPCRSASRRTSARAFTT